MSAFAGKKCCKRVYRSGSTFGGSACANPVKHEIRGNFYCTIHHPDHIKAKNEKAVAEFLRKAAASDALLAEERAAKRAEEHKVECFDDLVAALVVVRQSAAWGMLAVETRDLIDAAIAKSQGGAT